LSVGLINDWKQVTINYSAKQHFIFSFFKVFDLLIVAILLKTVTAKPVPKGIVVKNAFHAFKLNIPIKLGSRESKNKSKNRHSTVAE